MAFSFPAVGGRTVVTVLPDKVSGEPELIRLFFYYTPGGEDEETMTIRLSDHFTYKKLLRFVLPSVVMMMFTSVYGVVDGLFVPILWAKHPLRPSIW